MNHETKARQLINFGITTDDLAWVVREIGAGRMTHTQGKTLLREVITENKEIIRNMRV